MRINKFLSECGLCSRREADRLVEAGCVTVNGITAGPGTQAEDTDTVLVNGKPVSRKLRKTYLKFYKPRGIVCTSERREKDNLADYLHLPERVTYAGRLDRASEGLLILTDDGDLIDRMMRARHVHEKEYEVTVDRDVTADLLARLEAGVYLPELGQTTRPCRAYAVSDRCFRIILTQGLNRQIRRMCASCGYQVKSLKRIRVVNILLEDLQPGEYRPLREEELSALMKQLQMPDRG